MKMQVFEHFNSILKNTQSRESICFIGQWSQMQIHTMVRRNLRISAQLIGGDRFRD